MMQLKEAEKQKVAGFTRTLNATHVASENAFSLVEVIAALAIVSLGLIALIGQYPAGFMLARESQYESDATMIAQNIFDELAIAMPSNAFVALDHKWTTQDKSRLKINLAESETYHLVYNRQAVPIGTKDDSTTLKSGFYFATLVVSPLNDVPGLSQIDVIISAPLSVPEDKRVNFSFVTLLSAR